MFILKQFFLFPKSSFRIRINTDLGIFKDSAIILYAIYRLFLNKSATKKMLTSVRGYFGQSSLSSFSTSSLPSRDVEYHLNIWQVQSLIQLSFLHQFQCLCRRQFVYETKCYATLRSFPPSMTYKGNLILTLRLPD